MEELKAAGGNTIRTWGLENAQEILDEAQRNGVMVMMGLWVQHERHGFDYNDEVAIKKQLETFEIFTYICAGRQLSNNLIPHLP
jgi:hypothetical protein